MKKIFTLFVLLSLLGWSYTFSQIPTSGLQAFYSFNGNGNDESGNGNNGIIYGATPVADRFGNAGNAYYFNGVDNYFDSQHFNQVTDISISIWAKFGPASNFAGLFGFSNSSNAIIFLGYNNSAYPSNNLDYLISIGTANSKWGYFDYTLNDLNWHHLVFSRVDEEVRLFVDGILVNTIITTIQGAQNGLINSANNLSFGAISGGTGPDAFFNGSLDDIRIYNRALNENEIQALYHEGEVNLTSGLVAYYPFNGNAYDESGNGNNGTVNGATLTTDRFGNPDKSYSFDGVDDYIKCLQSGPTGNPTVTASFWIKTNTTQIGQIIGYGSDGVNGNDFRIMINHAWCPSGISFDTYSNIKSYSTSFNNTWDFYSLIYDGTLGNNTSIAKIYKNGVLLNNVCVSSDPSSTNISSLIPITFGKYHGTVETDYYNGILDDIRIYNRALNENEIQALYHEGEVNLTSGLVAYYPFNGNADDESGNGNNGTVNGATLTADRFGNGNSAYSFDGNDHVNINSSAYLEQYTNNTIATWIYPTNFNEAGNYIISKGSDWNNGWYGLTYDSTGRSPNFNFIFQLKFSDGTNYRLLSTSIVELNTWYFVSGSFDGQEMKIYVNGELENTISVNNNIIGNGSYLFFGQHSINQYNIFGIMDDIRIYNRALNENEIQTLYLARTDQITVDAGPIVAPADTAIVNINTSLLAADDSLIAYQCNVAYDATKLEYAGRTLVGTIANGGSALVNSSVAGQLTISYMTSTPLSGTGSILKLKFKALALGNSPIEVSDFLYNTSPVIDITNDTVFIADIIPPTANITFNDSDIRYGDGLVITADFSEAMLESNVVKIALSGAVTVAATDMTRVSATQYTYTYTIPIAEGIVNIALSNGTDLAGNAVVTTPASGASFTIIGLSYGDVDDNAQIQAYDAALTLQYSVGIDPMPSVDPRPWEPWRYATANVDGEGDITANDAGLILQYSAGLINSFPVETKAFTEGNADVLISVEDGYIVFRSSGELIGLNVFVNENKEILGTPIVVDENMISAFNITADSYALGLATAYSPAEGEVIMRIPYHSNADLSINFNMVINTETKTTMVNLTDISGLGINNILTVRPNPVSSVLTVDLPKSTEPYEISLFDVRGQLLYSAETNAIRHKIDFSSYCVGVYYLKVKSIHGVWMQKLVKE